MLYTKVPCINVSDTTKAPLIYVYNHL